VSDPQAPESLIDGADLAWLVALAGATPPGNFVELGVYKGGSAYWLYQMAEKQGRKLYLYDTFAGHTAVDPERDDLTVHPQGRYAENAGELDRIRGLMPNAVICVGTFPETLVEMGPVAFVHADVDVYPPTKAICDLMPPLMVAGGMILFDDYPWEGCPGVRQAVVEAFGEGPVLPNGKRLIVKGGK